ncbi:hypothetical protein M0657_008186 [Pyricularia oryzae]|nr:hypothetical protein M0657_008186 [Pyricularia oryzae]
MSDRVLVQKGARSCGITTFLRGSLPNLFTYLGRHVGMYLAVFTLPVFVRTYRFTRWSPTIADGATTLKRLQDTKSRRENKVTHKTNTTSNRLTDSSSLLFPAHGAHGGRMLTSNSTDHYHLSRETGRPIEISVPTTYRYYIPTT